MKKSTQTKAPVIFTADLTKQYGRDRGIENVNLNVQEGEIFGFIGPNGAGKSTTIRTLLGLIAPTSGTATIFGLDIATDGPKIREEVGYLPSEVFYYDNMRVIDLLNYSASFYRKPKAHMQQRIHELAQLLDLDLHKKIDDLSYGNKKKVGIVQGLLHSPKLIILDEPTGGLDPLMQQTFFELLREENKRGATILFSSHILSEVQKLCHRIAIIKDGTIIKVENMKDLRRNSYLRCELELVNEADLQNVTLQGVNGFERHGTAVRFLYNGNINQLTALLSGVELVDLHIQEPELEEIFMHYYEKSE
ncbi:ABC transporter ATP-binding protein [Candidatus Saccharibacteria bacterium]|nr:ABC transporter ATP-binding protein [Candidatus Saccharibacteria bacterium]